MMIIITTHKVVWSKVKEDRVEDREMMMGKTMKMGKALSDLDLIWREVNQILGLFLVLKNHWKSAAKIEMSNIRREIEPFSLTTI